MHRTIRTSPLLLLLAVIAVLMLPAATAQADQVSAPVTGFLDDGSNFDGTFRVNRFRSTRLGVVASGLLIGTATDRGEVTDVISIRATVTVADMRSVATPGTGLCGILVMGIDPVDVTVVGLDFPLHLDAFDMVMRAASTGVNLGSRLCTIADDFDNGQFTLAVSLLNDTLDILADR